MSLRGRLSMAGSGSPARRALAANARRNSAAGPNRLWRWRDTRAAAWTLLERHVAPGAAVAVVGAGNGHDLPLRRLGRRAGRLDLVDLDVRALHRTRRRLLLSGVRADLIAQDVTHGLADMVIRNVVARRSVRPSPLGAAAKPIGRPPYDVVIADQFLSQLLYPALSDSHLSHPEVGAALHAHGQTVTNTVIAGLTAAAPGGLLVCIEDVLRWGVDHHQPFTIDEVLATAEADPDRALELVQRGKQPRGCNGRTALGLAGVQVVDRRFWRWPFAPGTDYLVCATVARCPSPVR
jgi:hypothetical protein